MNDDKAQDPVYDTHGGHGVMQPDAHQAASFGTEWSYSFWEFWTPGKICELSLSLSHSHFLSHSKAQLLTFSRTIGLMGCCCPGFLFGKTQARNKDPTLSKYSRINSLVRQLA